MFQRQDFADKELLLRIKTIMVLRIVFLTGFVALIIAFERQATQQTPIVPLSIVLCSAYILSIGYALCLRFRMALYLVACLQVMGDLMIVGGMVYATGGIESPLSFLFLFVIIATSVMLPRAASYFAASGASIVYGLLIDLEYFNIIQPIYFFPKSNTSFQGAYSFYIIGLNVASYFSVAFLGSILSNRLRVVKEELISKSQDLKKLQEFHKNVVQNMVSGLMTTDLVGRVTSVNTACETITACRLDACLGQFCHDLVPMKTLRSFFAQGAIAPLPMHIEEECERADGEMILVSMKISRLVKSNTDNPVAGDAWEGFICVFDDLTDIRKMEEKMMQSEQLAAVGKFSAGLAHEIRNPLASLSGSIQVLREGLTLENEYKHLMEIVIKETDRLNTIVSDFLSYSQPRKNNNTVIDITQLLEDIVMLMKNSNEYDPEIEIELKAPADHIIIQSDESQIKQMVWNLCVNGIQSMNQKGRLLLELQQVVGYRHQDFETERKGVVIIVEDQGKGIPPDKMESIFDPFVTTREEGVGLGLPTVVQIVQRFGGNVGLDSEVGRGTRFEIYLPQERSIISQRQQPSESHPESLPS